MEVVGPIFELLRGGSPWLVLLTALGAIGIAFFKALLPRRDKETGEPRTGALVLGSLHDQRIREVNERFTAEIKTWADRYADVDTRRLKAEQERDQAITKWLAAEQRVLPEIRAAHAAARELPPERTGPP